MFKRKITSKDSEQFRVIYLKFSRLVYHIASLITQNTEDSEDIMQDTFIAFYNCDNKFANYDRVRNWLVVVSRNLAVNLNQKKKREIEYLTKKKDEQSTFVFADDFSHIDFDLVLDYQEKVIFIFRVMDQLSFADISDLVNLPESNVIRIYKKALEKMKIALFGKK